MTAKYDAKECERLCREARPGSFDVNELTSWTLDCRDGFPVTAPAAERILRLLRAMADQLEAAGREIDRLAGEERRQSSFAENVARLYNDERNARLLAEQGACMDQTQINAVTAERDQLRAEVERVRLVVEAAERWRDRDIFDGTGETCQHAVVAAVDAYRAARDKAGGVAQSGGPWVCPTCKDPRCG